MQNLLQTQKKLAQTYHTNSPLLNSYRFKIPLSPSQTSPSHLLLAFKLAYLPLSFIFIHYIHSISEKDVQFNAQGQRRPLETKYFSNIDLKILQKEEF
jgi:hypothetical protein